MEKKHFGEDPAIKWFEVKEQLKSEIVDMFRKNGCTVAGAKQILDEARREVEEITVVK